jgi:DNA-binding response OmpR family regulator
MNSNNKQYKENEKFKILIIEDDEISSMAIEMYVKSLEYDVTHSTNCAKDALKSMHSNPADIVISDVKIAGDIDGTQVSQEIYAIYHTPIIFLSAYCSDEILIKAQKSHPIGYLTKPFREDELRALLKLASLKLIEENKNIIKKENFIFDLSSNTLKSDNHSISLSIHEQKLLLILIDASPITVSYNSIINLLWEDTTKSDNIMKERLRTLVKGIRKKTNENFITTIQGEGLKFEV